MSVKMYIIPNPVCRAHQLPGSSQDLLWDRVGKEALLQKLVQVEFSGLNREQRKVVSHLIPLSWVEGFRSGEIRCLPFKKGALQCWGGEQKRGLQGALKLALR